MDAACLDPSRRSGDGAVTVRMLTADEAGAAVPGLTDVLLDCVEGGASVSFMAPLDRTTAEGFWRSVAAGVERESASCWWRRMATACLAPSSWWSPNRRTSRTVPTCPRCWSTAAAAAAASAPP